MSRSPQWIAGEIAWQRWRLRTELESARNAQDVVMMNHSQANADSALRALVKHGCDEAEELDRARKGI